MTWAYTLMGPVGTTSDFLISSDDGADPTSLDGITVRQKGILYQT